MTAPRDPAKQPSSSAEDLDDEVDDTIDEAVDDELAPPDDEGRLSFEPGRDKPLHWVVLEDGERFGAAKVYARGWWVQPSRRYVAPPGTVHSMAELLQIVEIIRAVWAVLAEREVNRATGKERYVVRQLDMAAHTGVSRTALNLALNGLEWPETATLMAMLWFCQRRVVTAPWTADDLPARPASFLTEVVDPKKPDVVKPWPPLPEKADGAEDTGTTQG